MSLFERLSALEKSKLAVWVYDNDRARIVWANREALALWKAKSQDELLARDYSDNSPATQARLDGYMRAVRRGEEVAEDWTLYPKGKPTTMTLHGGAIDLDDGRPGILFQAMYKDQTLEGSMVRGVEALRHTSLLVSLFDEQGAELFHNPAVLREHGDETKLKTLFPHHWQQILSTVAAGEVFSTELAFSGKHGERWYIVEARRATDPVSGARAVLVQQHDVSKRKQAEELAETRSQLLEELHKTLALVESQRQEIFALSAPIIDVGQGTLAVPIIGELSESRGSELAVRLLSMVSEKRAQFVILDLTGCGAFDEAGARLLLRLTSSIELLGSRAVVTGVSAALSRTLVHAGVDLSLLKTLRSLRDGLEFCRQLTKRAA